MKTLIILIFTCLISGCSIPLSLTGNKIEVLDSIEDLSVFERLGEIECSRGCNFRDLKINQESCENELRNKAYTMGGTSIFILSKVSGSFCQNNASFSALVLKK